MNEMNEQASMVIRQPQEQNIEINGQYRGIVCSPRRKIKSGRPPAITLKAVKRVGKKVAQGVPLRYALAAENNREINLDSWHKAIQRNDDFRAEYERASAAFVEAACERLVADRDPANLKWILERRYPADFARKPDTEVNVTQTVGSHSPDDIMALEIARAIACPGERVETCDSLDKEAARAVARDMCAGIKIENLRVSADTMAFLLRVRQSMEKSDRQENENQEGLTAQRTASCPV